MKPRPLTFHPHATISQDTAAGTVTATMTLTGGPKDKALSFQIFPDKYQAFSNTPFTVSAPPRLHPGHHRTNGDYAVSIYSNDGFVRSFAGHITPPGEANGALPRVDADLLPGDGTRHEARGTRHEARGTRPK